MGQREEEVEVEEGKEPAGKLLLYFSLSLQFMPVTSCLSSTSSNKHQLCLVQPLASVWARLMSFGQANCVLVEERLLPPLVFSLSHPLAASFQAPFPFPTAPLVPLRNP